MDVPRVDPADIRAVWNVQEKLANTIPGQRISIGVELYKAACSPGADVLAVVCRVSQLRLLQTTGALAPWINDGILHDAAFEVAAKNDLKILHPGVVYNKTPFDVQEFIKQVEAIVDSDKNAS